MDIGGHTYEMAQTYRTAIFDLVANRLDWKGPIDAVLLHTPALHDAVIDAVIHFTGSVPKITTQVEGSYTFMRIQAAGYRATIGG